MSYLHSSNIEKDTTFSTDTITDILSKVCEVKEDICLQVIYNSVTFFLHVNGGRLIYATSSLAPFERLERHLRRLNNHNQKLRSQLKQSLSQFDNQLESYTTLPSDYRGILWLRQQGHLDFQQAITIVRRTTREVFESVLSIPDSCQYRFIPKTQKLFELCKFDLNTYIPQCQKRLEAWQAFDEKIWSTYQRPYLVTEKTQAIANLSAEQNQMICQLLKGLNFRQISAILDLDELAVAKILYPSMMDNTILIRDPKTPFDRLPFLPKKKSGSTELSWRGEDSGFHVNSHSKQTVHVLETKWKIAYVDDDSAAHVNFTNCLDRNLFSVLTIEDPLNAFSELIEFKPDLVALEVNMPHLNGYELCKLLRNHHSFKNVPIILLNQTREPIDIAKYRRAKATESLTKSFDRTDLLNIIFKYLQ